MILVTYFSCVCFRQMMNGFLTYILFRSSVSLFFLAFYFSWTIKIKSKVFFWLSVRLFLCLLLFFFSLHAPRSFSLLIHWFRSFERFSIICLFIVCKYGCTTYRQSQSKFITMCGGFYRRSTIVQQPKWWIGEHFAI